MDRQFCVYILANRKHGTLYVGVTNDLVRRIHQHKAKQIPGFTAKYSVDKLMYYEVFDNPTAAITKEKQIKKWHREWKIYEPSSMTTQTGTIFRTHFRSSVVMDSGTRGLRPLSRNDRKVDA